MSTIKIPPLSPTNCNIRTKLHDGWWGRGQQQALLYGPGDVALRMSPPVCPVTILGNQEPEMRFVQARAI